MSSLSRSSLSRFELAVASSVDDEELSDEELSTPFSPSAAVAPIRSAAQPEDKFLLVKESGTARGAQNTERSQMAHTFELFGIDAAKGILKPAQVTRVLKQLGYRSPDQELLAQRLLHLHSQTAPEPLKPSAPLASSSAFSSLASPLLARQRKFSFSNSPFAGHRSSDRQPPLISLTSSNVHSMNPQPQINFHQFLTLLQGYKSRNNLKARQLLRSFELLDIGNSGFVAIDLLKRRLGAAESSGVSQPSTALNSLLSPAEIERLMKFAVNNGAVPVHQPDLLDYKKLVFKLLGTLGDEEENEDEEGDS
jgi:Ca2+-binding EF-hand superfamily protein